jgi:hypothetical protein
VPEVAGIYGRHYLTPPDPALDHNRLPYVEIAPRMRPRTSRQALRTRIRYHFRGSGRSNLRLPLGCLLGLELRRVGRGKKMTFGCAREARRVDIGERRGLLESMP